MTTPPELTRGQALVLGAAAVPMVAVGGLGAWGTYTNVAVEFGRAATAVGVVAAGEGVTLVLALVMVGLTMLGQSAPAAVRIGLWLAPAGAAAAGLAVADTYTEAFIYAMTPMAMSVAAEGLGLLARRIVVHRTGIDMEARRRNADTMQRLAYHRARAQSHPTRLVRWASERTAWRLAGRVGHGDAELGAELVVVQRARLTEGADAALAGMLGPAAPALTPALPPSPAPAADEEPVPVADSPVPSRPSTTVPLSRPVPAPRDSVAARAVPAPTGAPGQDAPRDAGQRRSPAVVPAPVRPEKKSPSVRDTIYEALLSGADPADRAALRARALEVHGEVKGDNLRKSIARATEDFKARSGEGFYP